MKVSHLQKSIPLPLHKTNQGIGAIHHFYVDAENEFEIAMPFTDHTYALIINLNEASDSYRMNGQKKKLPAGYFNLFSLPPGTCRWILGEGINWFVVLNCTHQFLDGLRESCPLIETFLDGDKNSGATLNPTAHVTPPPMLTKLEGLVEHVGLHGALREMQLWAGAADLLFDAVRCSEQHRRNEINDDMMLELDRVYAYMVENLGQVHDETDLVGISTLPQKDFNAAFELVYNYTPAEMLHRERMTLAVNLLQYSDEHVFEISMQAGFPSLQHLVDAFYERYDMSPQTFRRRYGNPFPTEDLS